MMCHKFSDDSILIDVGIVWIADFIVEIGVYAALTRRHTQIMAPVKTTHVGHVDPPKVWLSLIAISPIQARNTTRLLLQILGTLAASILPKADLHQERSRLQPPAASGHPRQVAVWHSECKWWHTTYQQSRGIRSVIFGFLGWRYLPSDFDLQ